MSDNLNLQDTPQPEERKRFNWISALLAAGLVAVMGVAFLQHSKLVNTELEVQTLQKEMAAVRETMKLSQNGTAQAIESMRQDLDTAKKETSTKVDQVQTAAQRAAQKQIELVARRVSSDLTKAQQEQNKQLTDRIEEIRGTAEQATARLTDISSSVGSVKGDVASARTDIDKTIGELKRVTGDLGVLSGLIATNSKEIAALRQLGEKDYYEFTLPKSAQLHRVADVQLLVKKVDPKRNRYTVEIVADDRKVEKKDKGVNEPVQFYVQSKGKLPYELVVNQVNKTQIVGYLAAPKLRNNGRS